MKIDCPVCHKPLGLIERLSGPTMCKHCFKTGAKIEPLKMPEDVQGPMGDDEVIRIECAEPSIERVKFQTDFARDIQHKIWPWGLRHVLGFLPLVVIVLVISFRFSFSADVFWISLVIWYLNLLLLFLIGRLQAKLAARYLQKTLGSEKWICEISKEVVTAKNPGYHTTFFTKDLTRIEDSYSHIVLQFGEYGRVRIPLTHIDTELERRLLARDITKRLQHAFPK